jgi:two-component system, cell cycle response regulator CpdR
MAHILLVEDNRQMAAALRKALERAGHSVTAAGDGSEALVAIKRSKIELVIADICMPNVDGIELIREIRRAGRTTRIIAISGEVGFYLRAARAVGADQTLKKPFATAALIAAINTLLAAARVPEDGRVYS